MTSTARSQTRKVAGEARNDALHLVYTARSEAGQIGNEVGDQARSLLAETRSRLEAQLDVEARRIAAGLAELGSQAVALATGHPEQAGVLADQAEVAAQWLDERAGRLEERGADGIAEDIADFAGRRPGVFLAAAATLGFGLGRLLRSGALTNSEEAEAAIPPARTVGR